MNTGGTIYRHEAALLYHLENSGRPMGGAHAIAAADGDV